MTILIKNGGYAFLIRLDLMVSMSLCPSCSAPALIYGTPKMHRFSSGDSFPKLRLIISSLGTFNYNISVFFAIFFHP